MKYCPQCKQDLPREMFRKNRSRGDGLDGWCRKCRRAKYNPAKDKERKKRYLAKHPDNAYIKFRINNPKKIRAQQLARYYIQERQKCSVEGCKEIGERHHHDYDRPLDIIWLCRKHHKQIHRSF